MSFADAYKKMLNGEKVRRKGWGGYWYINESGQVVIHLKDGKELANRSDDLRLTIDNTLKDDWEVI